MGKTVKAIVGIALVVVGVVTGNLWLVAQGVLLTASALMTPNPPERQASATTLQLGEVPRVALFGEAAIAGSLVDAFNWGGKYGTDWEAVVFALADHRCDALVGFYVDDTFYPFTGDGAVSGFGGNLFVKWFDGSEDQGVGDDMLNFGGYTADDNLAGMSYALVTYRADASDAKHPVWPSGRPRFLFVLRGKLCYDARKDSTVAGGSGTHRWNDPATWEWSDNPIVCRYNWARGVYACDRVDQPEQLLVGRGLSAIEAPPENVAWRANICDEDVDLASGGTEKRYRIAAIINSTDQFLETEETFAASCGGVITQPEGAVEIEPGHAKSPVAYITDADLVVGSTVTFSTFRSEADEEWCNTVIARYVEPTQKWVDHSAPIRRNYDDVIADGGARERTLPLGAVTSVTQAQRCAEIWRRLGRLPHTATITLGPRFAGLEEGDWIVWTSARRTGGVPMTFRVEAYGLDQKWQNSLSLRAINAEVYDWTVEDEIAPGSVAEATTPPAAYGAPDADAWGMAGASIGVDGKTLPALEFLGSVEDIYASTVRFEYREYDALAGPDDNWVTGSLAPASVTQRTITSVKSGVEYEGAVSYTFPGGQYGDRLVLGPVTAGDLSTGSLVSIAIRTATVTCDTNLLTAADVSGDGQITIADHAWDYPNKDADVPRDGDVLTGLTLGTRYYVYFDDATQEDEAPTYVATTEQLVAINSTEHPFRHYLDQIDVPGSGEPPSSGGGGGGGGGGGCPADDMYLVVQGAGPTLVADIEVGMSIWARHQTTGIWGWYAISSISFFEDETFEATILGDVYRTSKSHLWWMGGAWRAMGTIADARSIGTRRLAAITVDEAHTYRLLPSPESPTGMLSHNKVVNPD